MKTTTLSIIIIFFAFTYQSLSAQIDTTQIDTIYCLGTLDIRYTPAELKLEIEGRRVKSREEGKDDPGNITYDLKFEPTYEEIKNDTLFRHGGFHYIALSLLDDAEKSDNRLNSKIPSFNFMDLDGQQINSSELTGKVLVLNFWFTRCAPCLAEMPYLDQIKEEYESDDVVFISMAPENTEQVKIFLAKHEFSYRHIPDADDFLKLFGIGFPKNILVDKQGIVRYIDSGIMGENIIIDEKGNEVNSYILEWDALKSNLEKIISE